MFTHGGRYTRLYNIWTSMFQRCYNPNHDHFKNYGGRGIGVCNEWIERFELFREWAMSNGYQDGLTIDRKDNDKGYYPDNCQWIPRGDNTRKRNRKLTDSQILEIKSRLLLDTDTKLAKEFNVSREAISKIRNGRRWGDQNSPGREASGSKSYIKLTESDVLEIKNSSDRGVDLAKKFNVSPATICLIRKGKNWPHVGVKTEV